MLHSPAQARSSVIKTVYRDLALFDNLTPGQNFFAGREEAGPAWLPRGLPFLRQKQMDAQAEALLQRLGVTLPRLDTVVATMSGGQRQAVAVARSAMFAKKVVILDEPTAALGQRESGKVLERIALEQVHLFKGDTQHNQRLACLGSPSI